MWDTRLPNKEILDLLNEYDYAKLQKEQHEFQAKNTQMKSEDLLFTNSPKAQKKEMVEPKKE
jgi:hypothetical protein